MKVRKRIRDMPEQKYLAVATYYMYLAVATYHLAAATYFLTFEADQFLFLAMWDFLILY